MEPARLPLPPERVLGLAAAVAATDLSEAKAGGPPPHLTQEAVEEATREARAEHVLTLDRGREPARSGWGWPGMPSGPGRGKDPKADPGHRSGKSAKEIRRRKAARRSRRTNRKARR